MAAAQDAGVLHFSKAFGPPHPLELTVTASVAVQGDSALCGALRLLLSYLER